jgi:hypothetical protein
VVLACSRRERRQCSSTAIDGGNSGGLDTTPVVWTATLLACGGEACVEMVVTAHRRLGNSTFIGCRAAPGVWHMHTEGRRRRLAVQAMVADGPKWAHRRANAVRPTGSARIERLRFIISQNYFQCKKNFREV